MDTMRGNYSSLADGGGYDASDDEIAQQVPPPAIGQDERRMQVRAYNHWASLLADRNFPAIEDLEPHALPDFGPYSVLLDFSTGIENPGITFLGAKLAEECGVGDEPLETLADVPSRSLLTRITDHYMQILANQSPIGFEAEFVNQRGLTIAYRGILLPFSSDDDTIDFIFGVINWKELADAQAADELLLEIDQALDPLVMAPAPDADAPLTDWADGPGIDLPAEVANDIDDAVAYDDEPFDVDAFSAAQSAEADSDDVLPLPAFGDLDDEEEEPVSGPSFGSLLRMPMQMPEKAPLDLSASLEEPLDLAEPFAEDPAWPVSDVPAPGSDYAAVVDLAAFAGPVELADEPSDFDRAPLDAAGMELGDWLAAAREMAALARNNEDRTRSALYDAIGRAYDFSLAATGATEEFDELLADAGLTMQDRAPMTPVVKLVFGADYDKTRLTEYAAALTHAHRLELAQGSLGDFLRTAEGGLKGVVKAERRLRRAETGQAVEPLDAPRHALAKKLRALPGQSFDSLSSEGNEFALVMIRRDENGIIVVLGEVPDDVALVERAGRRLIG
jgi:hypothetical protein